MAKLQVKVLHDSADTKNQPLVIVADGKTYNMAAGDQQVITVEHGLHMDMSAVTEKGVPLGNQVSPAAKPGMSRTDPRDSKGQAAPSGTHHEPTSPPNTGDKPAPVDKQPPVEQKLNDGAVNPKP